MVLTAAPADTVKIMSYLMLRMYSLGISNSGMGVNRPGSPRLLDFGTIVGLVDVIISFGGDLSSLLRVGATRRDVEGLEGVVFTSLTGTTGGASSLEAVSVARVGYVLRSNWI